MMKRKRVGRRAPTALDSNLTLRAPDDLTLQSSNEQASPDASRKRSVSMKLAVGVVLFAALLLRVGWVAHTHAAHLSVDAGDYDRLAHSIAGGHGYLPSAVGIGPSAYRPPAYPYFLAAIYKATGRGWLVARYIEAALSTLTVVLIGLLAWQLWDRRTALIALALAAVFPPLIMQGTILMSEALLVPLIVGAVLLAWKARGSAGRARVWWLIGAGITGGLAALTRGNAFVLLLPLALIVWGQKPRLRWRALSGPVLMVAAALATIAPWTIRNEIVLHSFVPVTTETGVTLAGTYNDFSAHLKYPALWAPPYLDPAMMPIFAPKLDPHYKGPRLTEPEVDQRTRQAAFAYIRRHPAYVFTVGLHNALRLLKLSGEPHSILDRDNPAAPLSLDVIGFYAIAILAMIGWRTRARRRAPLALWLTPALFGLVVFVIGYARIRAPIDPFLILLAALGVEAIVRIAGVRSHKDPSELVGGPHQEVDTTG